MISRSGTLIRSALLALYLATPPAQAAPAPIVFDFEDGLQGWTLGGSAQRVQTQILGGEWAIFGDGFVSPPGGFELGGPTGTFLSTSIDLTGIASISVEQFFLGGSEDGLLFFEIVIIENIVLGLVDRLDVVQPGNPSLRAVDVSLFTGVHELGFFWGFEGFESPPDVLLPPVVAFIDNITFHHVPESSSWFLLSLGIAGVVMIRRKLASRAQS